MAVEAAGRVADDEPGRGDLVIRQRAAVDRGGQAVEAVAELGELASRRADVGGGLYAGSGGALLRLR